MKQITLTDSQYSFLIWILNKVDDDMGNAGCNDLEEEVESLFTPEEGRVIADEFEKYNDPETTITGEWPIADFCLVYWLKKKMEENTKTI